jgi:hypothetical protein
MPHQPACPQSTGGDASVDQLLMMCLLIRKDAPVLSGSTSCDYNQQSYEPVIESVSHGSLLLEGALYGVDFSETGISVCCAGVWT